MMNKKLIALLMAVTTISASVLAYDDNCWIEDGKEYCEKKGHFFRDRKPCYDCDDLVSGTPRRVGETVESTGKTVGKAANAVTLGIFE